jgi:cytochrome c
MKKIRILYATLGTAALVVATVLTLPSASAVDEEYDVLVFSKTAGFRHGSIAVGRTAIQQLGAENGFSVTLSNVLDETQQGAFERYIQAGGGYVGIHAASDTEYDWGWYGGLVGAYFNGHPAQQTATIKVAGRSNPSTAHLPNRWERFDEWYNFRNYTDGSVRVLARLDETTYDAGTNAMGDNHPIAWCHPYDGGRAWYTGLGHTDASYSEPAFLQHVLGGIQQVAGVAVFNCDA